MYPPCLENRRAESCIAECAEPLSCGARHVAALFLGCGADVLYCTFFEISKAIKEFRDLFMNDGAYPFRTFVFVELCDGCACEELRAALDELQAAGIIDRGHGDVLAINRAALDGRILEIIHDPLFDIFKKKLNSAGIGLGVFFGARIMRTA